MNLPRHELLTRLGRGESIESLCNALGIFLHEFEEWWNRECADRVPPIRGQHYLDGLHASVRLTRDGRGVPHVFAENDQDLMFGFGYATAQDRLFQLDYVRRRGRGRLAEVLGPEALESDRLFRTLDLAGIAAREWDSFDPAIRLLVESYAAGINAWMNASRSWLPIEFGLLDYEPEPWRPEDCLVIVGDFRWYLTGRFPVIVVPELVKRAVGDGPLYRAFLASEADDECILPPGSYEPGAAGQMPSGATGEEGPGSNNWVLSGQRTVSGKPLVANDPHIPFAAVSLWYEVRLEGGSFQVAGAALAGMPGILIGRNRHVAWGITNNICSQRDLYQERGHPEHPGYYLDDGQWQPETKREEIIGVRSAAPERHVVRSTHNGPLVDHLLPRPAGATGPVSLRWLGFERCGWVPAVLAMNRAGSAETFRHALRPWVVPTFNVVYADRDGHIGYQCTGRLPCREVPERGYRPGWDPQHRWQGTLPWEGMPRARDPQQGFLITANNRVARDDFPYPLSGTWVTGHRAARIRMSLEQGQASTPEDHRRLQLDVYAGRAATCVPRLLVFLERESDPRLRQAAMYLAAWDYHMSTDSVAAAIYHVFFAHWCATVAAERLPADAVDIVAATAAPLALELLAGDQHGWFQQPRHAALIRACHSALDELTRRFGPEMQGWQWGRLHVLAPKHFLSARGDLGTLLDFPVAPVPGEGQTVNSTAPDANYRAWLGAGFRFLADMADPAGGYWTIEAGSASGHPGSPHYADQLAPWLRGELFYSTLQDPPPGETLVLIPAKRT
ncbi:MAG: penicillin acylase family protein [Pirellulaceae bacterium]